MKTRNRLIAFILSLALFLIIPPMVVSAETELWTDAGNYDTSWYNVTDLSFVLSNPQQLAGLAVLVNGGNAFSGKTITLMGDINLSEKHWKPIGGVSATNGFEGSFDGGGHEITGLTITSNSLNGYHYSHTTWEENNRFAGLFGAINATGVVSNVNIGGTISFDLSAINKSIVYAGGIAGANKGSIINCNNNATIIAENAYYDVHAGGIAGYSYLGSAIQGCKNTGNISATSTNQFVYIGGISGFNRGTIINCVNTGTATLNAPFSVSSRAGGISGVVVGTIENCYNTSTGSISVNSTGSSGAGHRASAGGIAGETFGSASIQNSYSTANVITATAVYARKNVGGLVGREVDSKHIKNSYWFHGGSAIVGIANVSYHSKYISCGYFSDNTGALTKDTSSGTLIADNLLTSLNLGVSSGYYGWEIVAGQNSGYPVFMQLYSVSYDANGGTGSVPATIYDTNGHIVNVSFAPMPTKPGYAFLGWNEDKNATSAFYTQEGIKTLSLGTNDVKLFAVWEGLSYTVTNTLTNITSSGSGSATCGTNYTATLTAGANYNLPASILVKAGSTTLTEGSDYTYDASTGVLSIQGEKITNNIEIIASANASSYTITYNLNGGTQTGAPVSYIYGIGATLPTAPTKRGYSFEGWYDNADLIGLIITDISTTATGNKTYWAKWNVNSYIPVLTAKGVIDRPANAATVSGTIAVTGWFLDDVAVKSIEVLMNDQVVGTAQYGITRNDVALAYPDYDNSNAGFYYALNTTTFANGSYSLGIQVTDENDVVKTLPARTIVVANALKAFGAIDRPFLGVDISGRAAVTGWFLNDKGVEKVEVLIDGEVVGEATYNITRNDVAAAYPVYNNSTAGYQYVLDTATLTNGEYTLTIEATDLEGTKTTVANRAVTVNNVLQSIGTIDAPSNNEQVDGTIVVRGWYLDPNGVAKIEILVDDHVMGEAYYGTTRNDVFAVYGSYNNAQSGYYYMLDTTVLNSGEYTLTIKVTDTLGNVKALIRSIIVEN